MHGNENGILYNMKIYEQVFAGEKKTDEYEIGACLWSNIWYIL